jgi:murein L,D-transpeptidase YcbB/YkuD
MKRVKTSQLLIKTFATLTLIAGGFGLSPAHAQSSSPQPTMGSTMAHPAGSMTHPSGSTMAHPSGSTTHSSSSTMAHPTSSSTHSSATSGPLSHYTATTAPILRVGSRGQAVHDVQAFLQQKHLYTGPISGTFSAATRQAVIAFQQAHRLTQDGVIGRQTWTALLSAQ